MRPEVLRQKDRSRLSLQCESKIKNSYFRVGQHITYSRFQLIQVIFTSQTYDSCHPSTCKARILNLPRSIDLNKPQAWEYPLDPCLFRGNRLSSRFKHGPCLKRTQKRRLQSDVLFTPSPKGPATDKPVLMPTEASSVSPSGLAPTRENYFRPRAPLNPETSTRPRSVPGKFVLLQVRTRMSSMASCVQFVRTLHFEFYLHGLRFIFPGFSHTLVGFCLVFSSAKFLSIDTRGSFSHIGSLVLVLKSIKWRGCGRESFTPRLEVAVLHARLFAGIVGGCGECLLDLRCGSKCCMALHANRLWWHLQGTSYSGDVKGISGIRGNEENLAFLRTNIDG
ncbi:hypothetical protein DY000_02031239 [Brassica cretica]|uniref:Uncharacterized protein n=1 Tax=Brassica cretica TaxID=69181 RepID=A0ABQ7DX23_BRACR|nr:hypothetical protein DY000_02031239 [Brassica cretica]